MNKPSRNVMFARRPGQHRWMRTWRGSFVAALVVVTIAMFSAAFLEDVSAGRPLLSAPIVPATYLEYAMFIGGPHGSSLGYYQEASVIFVIALAMWWAVLEGCRRLWNRLRPR